MAKTYDIPGRLVAIPGGHAKKMLDGFWCPGSRRNRTLVVFQHGMGGNFCHGRFKKELLQRGGRHGFDVLSMNNSGHDRSTLTERFLDCVGDLDAMLRQGRRWGYRRFVLVGHSTGCQKITYYQARRRDAGVKALVLAGPADDHAIARRDLGSRYPRWIARARRLIREGQGDTLLVDGHTLFGARRFLSAADPKKTEAALFDYQGRMHHFRRVRIPIMVLFGADEEYACMPIDSMGEILRAGTRSEEFKFVSIPGADHGFHGREIRTVETMYRWLKNVAENAEG